MNELRRIKNKLKLLTTEDLPIKQLLLDFVTLQFNGMIPENSIEHFTMQLKALYYSKIKELETKDKYVQQKIDYNEMESSTRT